MKEPLEVFFSYAHEDEIYRNQLATALSALKRRKLITSWHDRNISPGTEWKPEIEAHIKSAHIILLLISPDFIASDFCWGNEVKAAIKRHKDKDDNVRVIPIIVRPTNWKDTPFSRLQALPTDGQAITSWPNIDKAFLNVTEGIEAAITDIKKK